MKKRFLALLLTFSFVFSAVSTVGATETSASNNVVLGTSYNASSIEKAREELSEDKEVEAIITLKENSKTDFSSLKTEAGKKARLEETKVLRNSFKSKLEELKISYEIIFEYDFLFAGFAIKASKKNLKEIEKIEGVESVELSVKYDRPLVSKRNKDIRDGLPIDKNNPFRTIDSNNLIKLSPELQKTHNGQGRVVAVLDSGLDVNHPILRVSDVSKGMYVNEAAMNAKMAEVGINYGSWRNDKVVYAHNYYSNGENVKEDNDASHGMHVSGTAVGNPLNPEKFVTPDGQNADELIVGVAPEAQLIFMNVFNKTGNTFTHAYAKALEDSVKLGADSVNLSLGAPNGTEINVGKAMFKAIEFARSMGSIVAIAAGNDGHYGFRAYNPVATNPDYGTVGSPGVAKDALTVAAMNTTIERSSVVNVKGLGALKIGVVTLGEGQTEDFLKGATEKEYDYVVVPGLGNETDFAGLQLSGKIALIKRGAITFATKIANAQKNGAVGVIIYNHEQGGDEIMGMDYGEQASIVKIPAVFMGVTDGKKMADNASNEKKVTFTSALMVTPFADGGTMTDFSSYGYSTDGEFKPDIAAPGGLIYSSINNGRYMSMNGTSMATPHVAGAVSIVRKALIEKNLGIAGEAEHDLIKALMMSTADPVFDKGTTNYVSPRKQGAGALNVAKAISTNVYLLNAEDNMPKVALRNLSSPTFEFKVKVVNFGNVDHSLKYHTVLGTDAVENGLFALKTRTLEKIEGETITVGAGETKEVTIKIDATKYEDELKGLMPNGYFLEGFVVFNDSFDNGHVVSIPFSGFRGNWADIPVWEKPIYDFGFENNKFTTDERPMYFENVRGNTNFGVNANMTSLVTLEKNDYAYPKIWNERLEFTPQGQFNLIGEYNSVPIGFDYGTKSFRKDKLAFSPNGDGNKDFIAFRGVFYRNTAYLRASVYKEGELNPVFVSGTSYFGKNSNAQRPGSLKANIALPTEFHGIDSNGQALPEGRYDYVVTAVSTVLGATEQELRFNVIIDRTSPVINTPVIENNVYTPDITDELSGVESTIIVAFVNGQYKYLFPNAEGKFDIPQGTDNSKSVIATFDYAGNISTKHLDGTEVVNPVAPMATTGVIPVLRISDFKDRDGNLIPNTDGINMYTREGIQNFTTIINLDTNTPVRTQFIDGRFPLPAGRYKMIISQMPPFYSALQPNEKEFEVVDGKFSEVVFTTTVNPYTMEANKGEVSINLSIDGAIKPEFLNYFSYVIKDSKGNVVEKDNLEFKTRVVARGIDNNGMTDVGFDFIPYFNMDEGDYTLEVTTHYEDLDIEAKVIPFKVVNGKVAYIVVESSEINFDIVNISFDGVDELPEGVKVTLVNKETNKEVVLRKSKFNDKAFSDFVVDGTYIVKIDIPSTHKIDKNNFEITISGDKYKDTIVLSKIEEIDLSNSTYFTPSQDNLTRTGKWEKVEDKWYYRDENAKDIYKKSWAKINNKWYYFDKESKMLESEWLKDGKEWYYLNADGSMASNQWKLYEGRWYWLQENGSMASNQWIKVKGEWFWAYISGKIAENEWVYVSGKWYYAKSGGYIAINTVLNINGKKYKFDKTGALVD